MRHLKQGSRPKGIIFQDGNWVVLKNQPNTPTFDGLFDRDIRSAPGLGIFIYPTLATAIKGCQDQQTAEQKALRGQEDGDRYERKLRARTTGVSRFAEMVPRISDFEAAAEIDFETSEFLFECGTSFAGKDAQLKRLCVIARLSGKMVIGLHRISDPTDLPRLASYKQALDNTTFWSGNWGPLHSPAIARAEP
ncbi:hypothetical protein [Tuwongella immobilis]|uniref:hypothetical protein n=1 Tax=Tuwongella immobilis TaxID=692036 RepID=UPI001E61682C|nr:hypothetical protein [Tuwongella immobilis]